MIKTLTILFVVFFATPALACPFLESGNPKVGSIVSNVDNVELEFSGMVVPEKSTLTVTDKSGKQFNTGKAYGKSGDENFIGIKVSQLPPGKYTVTWNLECDCGDMVPGDYKFTVK